ncbi:uncharacterized protein LOC125179396 [Hyalella azteca]|uniref:Uncharacterized protein LOC125179396 n=1 Tax=Hyalella azteca TaxID=294128 RepID=A0A979FV67_HYAAZ|nr:uncharacterized protein LOC125179396 [Hyalella azteca]
MEHRAGVQSVEEFVADDGGLDPTFLADEGSPAVTAAVGGTDSSDDEGSPDNPLVAEFAEDLDASDLTGVVTNASLLNYGEVGARLSARSDKTEKCSSTRASDSLGVGAAQYDTDNSCSDPAHANQHCSADVTNRSSSSSVHSCTNLSLKSDAKSSSISASFEIVPGARLGRLCRKEEQGGGLGTQLNPCEGDSDSDAGHVVIAGYSSDVEIEPVIPQGSSAADTPDAGVTGPDVSTIDSWLSAAEFVNQF